eukprot:CAMPEP_0203677760 /NCGR_PEP_ID=MMETSP0090-20130426/29473_1 /ASSEMBLY_ACC=CAM_ASM_001088 /TAXON_ID=426623 /ORGANISM="Chaetoceros affinis, Strain CCMP159" /LENGTH=330 /DNA_ID=CAMNT_0050544753 /DNA_START=248 /DNA_END=1240 /DNA_ORIENTATION=+
MKTACSSSITADSKDLIVWREKICHWTYSVIDHFELHRETVALSIDLFDRFLATRGNRCDGSFALLASLTTLYIAIKVHEKKKIKLSTLTQLSRGQFEPAHIEDMEIEILKSLEWLVHPPMVLDFVTLFLKFLPPEVSMPLRTDIFESTQYLSELSVCDPFFIQHDASTVALAAILNVIENDIGYDAISVVSRDRYLRDLQKHLLVKRSRPAVRLARDRLQSMLAASRADTGHDKENGPYSKQQWSSTCSSTNDEVMRSPSENADFRNKTQFRSENIDSRSKTRFRSDSIDSTSVGSGRSGRSGGSRGSKGSRKGKRFFGRSPVVTPFSR